MERGGQRTGWVLYCRERGVYGGVVVRGRSCGKRDAPLCPYAPVPVPRVMQPCKETVEQVPDASLLSAVRMPCIEHLPHPDVLPAGRDPFDDTFLANALLNVIEPVH